MRKIGFDVGDKTVGVAVSDPLGFTAQGIMTLERVGIRKDTGKIFDLIREYECDTVVIGLPEGLTVRTARRRKKSMNSGQCLKTSSAAAACRIYAHEWQMKTDNSHGRKGSHRSRRFAGKEEKSHR